MQPWPGNRPDDTLSALLCTSTMTSFLRPLAYRYRWIYDTATAVSSLSVGGVERLRSLGLETVQPHLKPGAAVLALCCGSGEAAAPCLAAGFAVTGLDVSPRALDLAAQRHPRLERMEGLAEDPPMAAASFSAAVYAPPSFCARLGSVLRGPTAWMT